MKKGLLVLLYCLLQTGFISAQAVNWAWAVTDYGTTSQGTDGIAIDPQGNVYMTGSFVDTSIMFGNLTANTKYDNTFLVKYNPGGSPVWLCTANVPADTDNIVPAGVATDGNSNVYIAGAYAGSNISFGTDTLPAVWKLNYDMFITKYDQSGNLIWVKAGVSNAVQALAVATDMNNNLYVTGNYFGDSVVFDAVTLYNPNFNLNRNQLTFLVKYNAAGQVQWALQADTNTNSRPAGMAIDRSGNVYISGGIINVGPVGFGNIMLSADGAFIFKFDPSGNVLWGKGYNAYSGNCLTTDPQNNVYMGGNYYGDSLKLGAITIFNQAGNHQFKGYVVKLDSTGNSLWAKSLGAGSHGVVSNIALDINNNIYLSGNFDVDSITVDSTALHNPNVTLPPIFVIGFDSTAKVFCSVALSSGSQEPSYLSADNLGNVYLAGEYGNTNTLGFDTFTIATAIATDTFVTIGGTLSFLAKINNILPAGINNIQAAGYNLQLYPNPFSNIATVQYKLPPDAKSANLIIYDILGRERSNYPLTGTGKVTINSNNLSSGVYLCSLVVDGRVLVTEKMVVE